MPKHIKFFWVFLFVTSGAWAANDAGFNMAARLLSAARNGDTNSIQNLISMGADVNYVDSTGVSVVCTAVMNNDMRAVQVLQMYGADASQCDKQIKNYKARTSPQAESGLFAGLTPTHRFVLGAVGVGAVVGGLLWVTNAFDSDDDSASSGGSGSHLPSGGGGNSGGSLTAAFTIPYGPAMVAADGSVDDSYNHSAAQNLYSSGAFETDFATMNQLGNYLLMMHGYSAFARGYLGQLTLRALSKAPVPSQIYGAKKVGVEPVTGGLPINVALVTANGVNAADNTSLANRFFVWSSMSGNTINDVNAASNTMISSKYFNNQVVLGGDSSDISDDTVNEIADFDLSGNGTAIHNTGASVLDDLLAKIVAGYTSGNNSGDFVGFVPNGQLTVYRTGGGTDNSMNDIYYYNYKALVNALSNSVTNMYDSTNIVDMGLYGPGRARVSVIANADVIEPLHAIGAKTLDDFISLPANSYQTKFYEYVNNYYSNGVAPQVGINTPAQNAQQFFADLGIGHYPLTVFSTGATLTDSLYSGAYKMATFENAAPLVFSGSRGLFMSVVAVNLPAGATSTATNVSGFSTSEKYNLSQWSDGVNYYKSRICGIAGTGVGDVDPWCFAAVGLNDEQAAAAAAGAAATVKAAFSYLSNKSIFNLLALTADGAYLGTNSMGEAWGTSETEIVNNLSGYLQTMYELPEEYKLKVSNNLMTYLDAFKEVYGFGLINLDRATTPNKSIYYYTDGKIVSGNGNAYWRSASSVRGSSVFGARGATIPVSFYDVISDNSGQVSVPRIWNTQVALGLDSSYGLYMGDTLSELKTRDVDNTVKVGNMTFGFARSERNYDDNMSGMDNLSLSYDTERFGLKSDYQHYLTDGAGRFTGLANPVLSLASNAISSKVDLRMGHMSLSGRGFIGNITSEGLLENDPVVSSNFAGAKLGNVMGYDAGVKIGGDSLSWTSNIGTMHETNTVLGAMLGVGDSDTNYIDSVVSYNMTDNIGLTLRGTFAWTYTSDAGDGVITRLSDLKSNSFAAGVHIGNFDLVASMPLALTDGRLYYSYADFGVNENDEVVLNNVVEYAMDLMPTMREYRLNASYKYKFGDWTDGALGFIYRINPNNTDKFGNESVFMMKLSHRLGI